MFVFAEVVEGVDKFNLCELDACDIVVGAREIDREVGRLDIDGGVTVAAVDCDEGVYLAALGLELGCAVGDNVACCGNAAHVKDAVSVAVIF
jgi:hypothetical protein